MPPNWDDTGDDDNYTCEYCGKKCAIEIGPPGHTCSKMMDAHKKQNKEYEKNFKGRGLVTGVLIIKYECYDSEEAFNNMMDLVSLGEGLEKGSHIGEDRMMNVRWQTEHRRKLK